MLTRKLFCSFQVMVAKFCPNFFRFVEVYALFASRTEYLKSRMESLLTKSLASCRARTSGLRVRSKRTSDNSRKSESAGSIATDPAIIFRRSDQLTCCADSSSSQPEIWSLLHGPNRLWAVVFKQWKLLSSDSDKIIGLWHLFYFIQTQR